MNRTVRRITLACVAATALCAGSFGARAATLDVAGIKIDDTAKVAGKDLKLNGAGVRIKAVFKVYTLALYLPKKETTVEAVLASAGPRRASIVMLRDVSGDEFGQSFMAGINANLDKAEKSKLVAPILRMGEIFINVGGLKKGDTIQIDWVPDKGLTFDLNGKPLAEPMPEQAFYNAILRIWLGDKPADAQLKPLLLGNKPDTNQNQMSGG